MARSCRISGKPRGITHPATTCSSRSTFRRRPRVPAWTWRSGMRSLSRMLVRNGTPETFSRNTLKPAAATDRLSDLNFDVDVVLAPQEGNSRQPVFAIDESTHALIFRCWQDVGDTSELRSRDAPADGARCDLNFGIVAKPLVLA